MDYEPYRQDNRDREADLYYHALAVEQERRERVWGSLIYGALIGCICLVCGAIQGKVALGFAGFIVCLVGNFILGIFLSIPALVLFLVLIFR